MRFADWGTEEICGFSIGVLIITNLRIFLRFVDLHTPEVFGFANAERAKDFEDLRFAD
jgi:hypothetical protein